MLTAVIRFCPQGRLMTAFPIAPLALDHIVLRTADVPAMMAFYVDVLGCRLEREVADLGLFQLRAGSALIDLVSVDGPLGQAGGRAPGPDGRNLDHFCLTLATFDEAAIRAHLARCGVEASRSAVRHGATGFGPSFYIRDPEGNGIELKAPTTLPGA